MKRLLPFLLVAMSIIGVVGYGLFEARRLLEGPSIVIHTPQDGSAVAGSLLVVEGVASNISFSTINDKPVLTDENGNFTKKFSPPAGATVVTVQGTDRFGRRASAEVHVGMVHFCPIT